MQVQSSGYPRLVPSPSAGEAARASLNISVCAPLNSPALSAAISSSAGSLANIYAAPIKSCIPRPPQTSAGPGSSIPRGRSLLLNPGCVSDGLGELTAAEAWAPPPKKETERVRVPPLLCAIPCCGEEAGGRPS